MPPDSSFVHLRCHSSYSLSEGAIKADKLAALAAAAHMPAVAIADTANLFGALEFSQACASRGVQPIVGCQVALSRPDGVRIDPDPVLLLAQNATGFANLQRLSSRGFLDTEPGLRPQISLDLLGAHADGLILLTGGVSGPLFRLLRDGQDPEARRLLAALADLFGDRIAVELHRHGLAHEAEVEPRLIALADTMGLPLVATNEVFFATPAMHLAHDALLCIAEGRTMAEQDRRRVSPEAWFKPAADMRALFADLPEACDNTLAIARRCAVMAETSKPLLPACPKVRPGQTEAETLRDLAVEGLARRMDAQNADAATRETYADRMDFELGVIERMGFPGYFLIVADFIQWAKAQDIPVGPGRGSGAGSVAAWALTITDIDPLPWGLLFERFLNPERVSMPDFDIDFCQDRRDEVIQYVQQRVRPRPGRPDHHLRQAAGPRGACATSAGCWQMPYGQVDKICQDGAEQSSRAGDSRSRRSPASRSCRRCATVTRAVQPADGHGAASSRASIAMPRTHAAGVVISDRPLTELDARLVRDAEIGRMLVTQFNDEICRAGGAGEVRLPRPHDADGAASARSTCWRAQGVAIDLGRPAAGRPAELRLDVARRHGRRVPGRRHRACATPCKRHDAPGPAGGRHRPGVALYRPGPDGQHPANTIKAARTARRSRTTCTLRLERDR